MRVDKDKPEEHVGDEQCPDGPAIGGKTNVIWTIPSAHLV
jgi:hypothetical protein